MIRKSLFACTLLASVSGIAYAEGACVSGAYVGVGVGISNHRAKAHITPAGATALANAQSAALAQPLVNLAAANQAALTALSNAGTASTSVMIAGSGGTTPTIASLQARPTVVAVSGAGIVSHPGLSNDIAPDIQVNEGTTLNNTYPILYDTANGTMYVLINNNGNNNEQISNGITGLLTAGYSPSSVSFIVSNSTANSAQTNATNFLSTANGGFNTAFGLSGIVNNMYTLFAASPGSSFLYQGKDVRFRSSATGFTGQLHAGYKFLVSNGVGLGVNAYVGFDTGRGHALSVGDRSYLTVRPRFHYGAELYAGMHASRSTFVYVKGVLEGSSFKFPEFNAANNTATTTTNANTSRNYRKTFFRPGLGVGMEVSLSRSVKMGMDYTYLFGNHKELRPQLLQADGTTAATRIGRVKVDSHRVMLRASYCF